MPTKFAKPLVTIELDEYNQIVANAQPVSDRQYNVQDLNDAFEAKQRTMSQAGRIITFEQFLEMLHENRGYAKIEKQKNKVEA